MVGGPSGDPSDIPRGVPRRALLAGSLLVGAGALASCTAPRDRGAPERTRTPTKPPLPPPEVSMTVVGAAAPAVPAATPEPAVTPDPAVTAPAAQARATDEPPAGAAAPDAPSEPWTGARTRPSLGVEVTGGTLRDVVVTTGAPTGEGSPPEGTQVPGAVADGSWTPTDPLEPGATYRAVATATNEEDTAGEGALAFTVVGEDGAVRAKMMPLPDERVGVGMPVVLYLTKPVAPEQRQALTDAMVVEPSVPVEGAWRWFSDTEAHWRPRQYWPAGTTVRVAVPLTTLDVGGGRYGVADRDFTFAIGDAHTSVVDADAFSMTTSVNGTVARTFPVSCGREDDDPSFVTRSGVHLVLAKHADFLMDGATVGLDYETPVKWATRIANSGEFVHGAPWSVADQGVRNVSHGCVNASDADAKWFHDLSLRGDPVDVVGTQRPMELTNGLGDWTLSWESWTSA